jgi:hypothetical protein
MQRNKRINQNKKLKRKRTFCNKWSNIESSLAAFTLGTIQVKYTNALFSIFPAATLLCPITPIGTQKRANLVMDAHVEHVAIREVAQTELQVGLSGRS